MMAFVLLSEILNKICHCVIFNNIEFGLFGFSCFSLF